MLFSSSDCGRGAHVLRVRSAPRPRLSRLLPFALWQDTSLQAKKQCSRRTTKHNFGCAFSLSGCGQGAHVPFCTFRSLSSPSSTCAPCSAFGQRLARDNNSATHARLSRFSTLALRPIISLFQTRSAPRPRLSRLLPFALWQDTSLQAKKQCSRRTTKHNFGCAFSLSGCGQGAHVPFCTFRSLSSPSSTCAPCSAFGQRLARDNNSATHARLSRFSTLALRPIISLFQKRSAPRSRLSRLLPFALWQGTSLQAKKQCSRRTTKARRFAVRFDIKSVDKRCVFRLLFYIRDRG